MNIGGIMNHYYDQIMALPSSYGIKETVTRWHNLSRNIEKYSPEMSIILPDILLGASYGVGKTHVLRLISEYLSVQKNLMDFYGDIKFLEFYVNYCKPDEDFSEIRRLMSEISSAAGFRSEYRGIVCLDINEWVRHSEEKHFIDLLEYLSVNSDHWLIIFTLSDLSTESARKTEAVISMFLRIEKAELKLPESAELLEYITRNLSGYGLELDLDAAVVITETIDKLRGNKYFDGYKTLDMLCKDIIYSTFSASDTKKNILTPEDIREFSADSEYVNSRICNYEAKKRYIGFTGGE